MRAASTDRVADQPGAGGGGGADGIDGVVSKQPEECAAGTPSATAGFLAFAFLALPATNEENRVSKINPYFKGSGTGHSPFQRFRLDGTLAWPMEF